MIETTFINSATAQYTDRDLSWVQELLTTVGYIADPVTGAATFQLVENSPNAHNLIVKAGNLIANFTKGGNTWKLRIRNTADTVLSVPQNVSGSTKYVHIVVKIDNVIEPNVARSNISSLVPVTLSTATPTVGDIQGVIGAFDFYSLGYVTQVNTNAVISNSLITNQSTKVFLTKAIDIQSERVIYPNGYFSGATYPVSPYVGQVFYKTTAPIGQQYWDGSAWVTPITDLTPFLGTTILTAGEAFTGATTPQPAKLVSDIVQPHAHTTLDISGSTTRYALRIIPRKNCTIGSVVFPYFWTGSDGAITQTVSIQTDSSNSPSGTVITNGTTDTRSLNSNTTTQLKYQNFTFSTPCGLVANTTYWVVVTLSSALGSTLRVPAIYADVAYCSFLGKSFNGSWNNVNVPSFELIPTVGNSESLWRSDADGRFQLNSFDYFVTSTASAGGSVSVLKDSTVSGFTGLDTNADYYLSNTIGTITKNRNEGGFVGTANSATTLIVPKNRFKETYKITNSPTGGTIVSGITELYSGNNNIGYPIFVIQEDGILNASYKPAFSAGNTLSAEVFVFKSYANNTSPKSLADASGEVRAFIGATNGIEMKEYPITLPLKKGDRVMFGNRGNASGTNLAQLYFTPI